MYNHKKTNTRGLVKKLFVIQNLKFTKTDYNSNGTEPEKKVPDTTDSFSKTDFGKEIAAFEIIRQISLT